MSAALEETMIASKPLPGSAEGSPPSLFDEYKQLAILEIESTKLRHTTFTAILSVSFLLPGLALQPAVGTAAISMPGLPALTLSKTV